MVFHTSLWHNAPWLSNQCANGWQMPLNWSTYLLESKQFLLQASSLYFKTSSANMQLFFHVLITFSSCINFTSMVSSHGFSMSHWPVEVSNKITKDLRRKGWTDRWMVQPGHLWLHHKSSSISHLPSCSFCLFSCTAMPGNPVNFLDPASEERGLYITLLHIASRLPYLASMTGINPDVLVYSDRRFVYTVEYASICTQL